MLTSGDIYLGFTFLEINGIIEHEPYAEYEYIYGIFVFLFAILGSILACEIGERTGRLKVFHLANSLNILGCIFAGVGFKYQQVSVYLIGRFLKGVVLGMFAFIVPLYSIIYSVREMVPLEYAGFLGAFTQVMNTFGNFWGAGLSNYGEVYVSLDFMFIIFLIPILFSLIQTFLILNFYNYESPSYLWVHNLKKEAFFLINKLYINPNLSDTSSYIKSSAVRSIEDICEDDESEIHSVVSYKTVLFSPNYRKSLLIACGLGLFKTLIGIDFFIILLDHNLSYEEPDEIYEITAKVLIYLANFLGALTSLIYIESEYYIEIGRVRLLRVGAVLMFFILCGISLHRQVNSYEYVSTLIGSFVFIYQASLGTVL